MHAGMQIGFVYLIAHIIPEVVFFFFSFPAFNLWKWPKVQYMNHAKKAHRTSMENLTFF